MNIFKEVKEAVTTRMAAEHYVGEANRYGMMCCPFHDDKHPSLKVDRNFICFGCGEKGDVIKFVQTLFNLTPKEAAMKIIDDFGLMIDTGADSFQQSYWSSQKRFVEEDAEKLRRKKTDEKIVRIYKVFADYSAILRRWQIDYEPKNPLEEWDSRYEEAFVRWDYVQHVLETILYGTQEDREIIVDNEGKRINELEQYVRSITDECREAA